MLDDSAEILARVEVDERPWGRFERFSDNEVCTVKLLTVKPGQSLSRQRHALRDELWVVLDAGLVVEVDGEVTRPTPGQRYLIRRGQIHRLISESDAHARVLEVAFGEFDELDIERLDDIYGRR